MSEFLSGIRQSPSDKPASYCHPHPPDSDDMDYVLYHTGLFRHFPHRFFLHRSPAYRRLFHQWKEPVHVPYRWFHLPPADRNTDNRSPSQNKVFPDPGRSQSMQCPSHPEVLRSVPSARSFCSGNTDCRNDRRHTDTFLRYKHRSGNIRRCRIFSRQLFFLPLSAPDLHLRQTGRPDYRLQIPHTDNRNHIAVRLRYCRR